MRAAFVVIALLLSPAAMAVDLARLSHDGKDYVVARVDLRRDKVELFLNDDAGRPFNRLDRVAATVRRDGGTLAFAMNAGMYHADFAPVGLFVAKGQQLAPVNLQDGAGNFFLKPNGIFLIDASGARVIESSGFAESTDVVLATQSGPLLLSHGSIHPAFKPDSTSRVIRNGVGIVSANEVVFAISEQAVNFHEFATFFRDVAHCPDALYFDGVVSSLYAPALHRNDSRAKLGPIIGVVER